MKTTPKLISFVALALALTLSMAAPAFAVDAPTVVVTDDLLDWMPVDAVSINVHRENGEYVETLPGDADYWQATASGSYFLVATDSGDWQGWGKSNTVTVNAFVQSAPAGDYAGTLIINNYYAKVYSQTSAEIFWELPSSDVVEVEVFRDDGGVSVISGGKSFYEASLQPNTTYYYTLFPYDSRGNLGPEVYVNLTTASATDAGSAQPSIPTRNPAITPDSPFGSDDASEEPAARDPIDDPAFNSRTDSWSIDGNTITFEVDGWFQVQREGWMSDYPTICEGVSTCEIDDESRYQIVNHFTGEVWQKVKANPKSLTWSQTGLYLGHLYWNSVVYNYEAPVFYSILVDDELWSTSDDTNTQVFGLARGTRYQVTIFAILADNSRELVAEQEILTDGPLAEVVPYGRPAATQDTFGFDLWDNVVERLQSFLPSDCLFALPAGDYCFSPSTRFLMEYNEFNTDGGPIEWEFQLPGDNSTNHIEGLAHFYGTGARRFGGTKRFALVTDVTTEFARSSYEISVFQGSGTFLGTFPILEGIQFSAGDGQERQINLDGADLRVTLGAVRPRESDASLYTPLPPRRLHIAGEYYEPSGAGSLTELSGWTREGAFLFVVDANTGETLTKNFYTGMTIDDVPVE